MVLVAILEEVGFFLIPAIVKLQIMEEHLIKHWFTVKEQPARVRLLLLASCLQKMACHFPLKKKSFYGGHISLMFQSHRALQSSFPCHYVLSASS